MIGIGIEEDGKLIDYLKDGDRKIPNAHLKSVCNYAQKDKTCRYIMKYEDNFYCIKKTPVKKMVDEGSAKNMMIAKSDNCEGLGNYYKKKLSLIREN